MTKLTDFGARRPEQELAANDEPQIISKKNLTTMDRDHVLIL